MNQKELHTLIEYLEKTPSITQIVSGIDEEGCWWVKFQINIGHELAWQVVQEIACVANYLSINERLPTVFYPISPPPYLNGGPQSFLSWIIETKDKNFNPDTFKEWLEGRLPNPVDDLEQWKLN